MNEKRKKGKKKKGKTQSPATVHSFLRLRERERERLGMSGTSSLLQLWQIPLTKLLFTRSRFSKGLYMGHGTEMYPALCFCKNMQTATYEVVNGSYVLTSQTKENKIKELAVPLRMYKDNFPNKKYLHPYERSLIELTLGDGNYEEVLGKVDALRKKVISVGKEHASLCAKSTTKREAEERVNEGMEKLEQIFSHDGKAVDDLLNVAKTLRAMPVVDLETPTLCLVGAPNVGKSSLVRILSTGKPEICNYPFTTRGILMGHIAFGYQNFQVTDTPGLLRRHDDDRNNLEKLTLAVLSHLPTAVLYVHDLSGECGTSASDQFVIYKDIRERFSSHLWIDVVSKCDLLQESPVIFITEDSNADHLELARYRKMGPDGAIHVSVKSEAGLNELKDRVHELLVLQSALIKSEMSNQENQENQVVPKKSFV